VTCGSRTHSESNLTTQLRKGHDQSGAMAGNVNVQGNDEGDDA
jgi:hypothetical protein